MSKQGKGNIKKLSLCYNFMYRNRHLVESNLDNNKKQFKTDTFLLRIIINSGSIS